MAKAEHDMWRYGPRGEAVLLKAGDDIPAGFKDSPAAFAEAPAVPGDKGKDKGKSASVTGKDPDGNVSPTDKAPPAPPEEF